MACRFALTVVYCWKRETCGCVMSIDQRIQTKRQEILRIAAEHGARNVRVFGSAAWNATCQT